MYQVNIYVMTDLKGPRRQDGIYAYLLEMPTPNGPATCQAMKEVKDVTKNRAELIAVVEALKRLNRACNLDIYTDSEYVSRPLNDGQLDKWRENGWLNSKKKEIANRDLWQKMAELLNGNAYRVHTGEHYAYKNCMTFQMEMRRKELGGKGYV